MGVVCVALFAVACSSSSSSTVTPNATASPATVQGTLLVFTRWVLDANVRNGPEPGYKPALTGLTGHDISTASAGTDATGQVWLINVLFTPHGRELFRQLTHDSVLACPGLNLDCAPRHIAIWLDLSQTDIDTWSDPTYAAKVSQPFDLGCLAQKTPTVVCPKFLSDPIIIQEISGGTTEIGGNFTEQSAIELANSINSAAHA
jgi:preprotein translocase subunit SecD